MNSEIKELIDLVEAWIARKDADACIGCAYFEQEEWEMPCVKCKRACKDYWRHQKQ